MSSVGKIRAFAAIAMLFGVGLATYGILNFTPSGPGFFSPDSSYNPYGGGEQLETKHSYGAYYGESARLEVAFGTVSAVLGVILWAKSAPKKAYNQRDEVEKVRNGDESAKAKCFRDAANGHRRRSGR